MSSTFIRRYGRSVVGAMIIAAAIAWFGRSGAQPPGPTRFRAVPPLSTPGAMSTARADLDRAIAAMDARLSRKPDDAAAAVTLAEALLRQTRVTGNAGLAWRAETALETALAAEPADYEARRMLGAVYLSQHRFRDAIREAERCRERRPNDASVYGILGDAFLELGDYPDAFANFDRMSELRPNAASYARTSYARELQGDLTGALRLMQMAADATSPQDPEGLAWNHAQIGHLYLEMGRPAEARREYEHADYAFPGHPLAAAGRARAEAAAGRFEVALGLVNAQLATSPAPSESAFAGDLLTALGRPDEAEQQYRLAEAGWRLDVPEPSRLARFLAARGRRVDDAVRIAESAAADRHDIFTQDALAWAYFKTGQIERARAAIHQALRTGSRDREILYHAGAIERAAGHDAEARTLAAASLAGSPQFDLVAAPEAARLLEALGRASRLASR
jgi:tetratricopeptide (TPR) repeat protein